MEGVGDPGTEWSGGGGGEGVREGKRIGDGDVTITLIAGKTEHKDSRFHHLGGDDCSTMVESPRLKRLKVTHVKYSLSLFHSPIQDNIS